MPSTDSWLLSSADGCLIMHGERYGKWQEWDTIAVHRGAAFGVPRGLLILEAQDTLLTFLCTFVAAILELEMKDILPQPDLDKGFEDCSKWVQNRKDQSKSDGKEAWLSVDQAQLARPFSKPPTFDIDAIIAVADSQLDALRDELRLLQTDPTHFRRGALMVNQGWIVAQPSGKMLTPEIGYQKTAMHMTYNRFARARQWHWVLEECRHVKHVHTRLQNFIHIGYLPAEYAKALSALEYILLHVLKDGARRDLEEYVVTANAFSKYWDRPEGFEDSNKVTSSLKEDINLATLYDNDRLFWALNVMITKPDKQDSWDIPTVLQLLENRLNHSSRLDRARISSILYDCVSEVAAIHQILAGLHLPRPYFPKYPASEFIDEHRPGWRCFKAGINKKQLSLSDADEYLDDAKAVAAI